MLTPFWIRRLIHQSCGNVVGSLSIFVVASLSTSLIVWRMCEHEVWIDPIQLEIGTFNAIFICVPEIK